MENKNVLFHQDIASGHKSIAEMIKYLLIIFALTYSPDLVPSDYNLFTNLKKMLDRKRYGSNEEVIAKNEEHLERLDISIYNRSKECLGHAGIIVSL